MTTSADSHCYNDSKIYNSPLPNLTEIRVMGKTSLVLLGVKLYSYLQSAVACFNDSLVLKKVWTQP